jgi:hypothetical protein
VRSESEGWDWNFERRRGKQQTCEIGEVESDGRAREEEEEEDGKK